MNRGLIITLSVVVAVVLVFGLLVMGSYNRLVSLDQDTLGSWSEVENQYQRQADLIPNMVSIVSSSVSAESNFVKDVIAARTAYASAVSTLDKDKAGLAMTDSVATLVNAVAESYPVLQANKQYSLLADEVAGTQNRITTARGRYIASLQTYNTAIRKFPSSLIAGMFGFASKEYYSVSDGALKNPVLGTGQLP